MRQAVMEQPGRIKVHEVPDPKPGPGEVLIRVRSIGVCGSDVHVWHGRHPYTTYPVVQGHEFSGEVQEIGDGVDNIEPGEKVTATPQIVCGRCGPCRRGDYHICDVLKVQGFQAPGCAQDLFITKAENVLKLPDSFGFEQGALVEPIAVAVRAVARSRGAKGKNAAVLGAGPIGNFTGQVAGAREAEILITDVSDFRLEIARDCGLQRTSNADKDTLEQASIRHFGNEGFGLAFECVGTESTVNSAIKAIQKGGTIVVIGVFGEKPRVDLGLVQDRELNLVGTLMYKYDDFVEAVRLIETGKIITDPLESKHFPLEEYAKAYHYVDEMGDKSMKVFIDL